MNGARIDGKQDFADDIREKTLREVEDEVIRRIEGTNIVLKRLTDREEIGRWKARLDELQDLQMWIEDL